MKPLVMEAIKTYKELVYNLNRGPGYDGYTEMVKAIDLNPEEIRQICHWNPVKYNRNCIYDTDELEALITCWPPRHSGPIHNYNLQQGWIKVLKGMLTIEFFTIKEGKADGFGHRELKEGEIAWLNDSTGFHQFRNESINNAIAIHFYIDKIKSWEQFNAQDGKTSIVRPGYDFHLEGA